MSTHFAGSSLAVQRCRRQDCKDSWRSQDSTVTEKQFWKLSYRCKEQAKNRLYWTCSGSLSKCFAVKISKVQQNKHAKVIEL